MATEQDFFNTIRPYGNMVLTKAQQERLRIATIKDYCGIDCPNSKAKITNRLREKLAKRKAQVK